MRNVLFLSCLFILPLTGFCQSNEKTPSSPPVDKNKSAQINNMPNTATDEEVLEKIKAANPAEYDFIMKMKDSSPDRYKRLLASHKMRPMAGRMTRRPFGGDPEMMSNIQSMRQNQQKLNSLARDYNNTNDASAKETLKKDMMLLLSQNFDLKIKMDSSRIEAMKKRISEQESSLSSRTSKKTEQIEKEFNMLLMPRQNSRPVRSSTFKKSKAFPKFGKTSSTETSNTANTKATTNNEITPALKQEPTNNIKEEKPKQK